MGVQIISTNYRSRFGEIDIIGLDQYALVFYEVKRRQNDQFGTPAARVSQWQQRRILKTALHFLNSHKHIEYRDLRFDVLTLGKENRWIKSAFCYEDLIPDSILAR